MFHKTRLRYSRERAAESLLFDVICLSEVAHPKVSGYEYYMSRPSFTGQWRPVCRVVEAHCPAIIWEAARLARGWGRTRKKLSSNTAKVRFVNSTIGGEAAGSGQGVLYSSVSCCPALSRKREKNTFHFEPMLSARHVQSHSPPSINPPTPPNHPRDGNQSRLWARGFLGAIAVWIVELRSRLLATFVPFSKPPFDHVPDLPSFSQRIHKNDLRKFVVQSCIILVKTQVLTFRLMRIIMICVYYSSCRFDFADLGESLTMIRLLLAFAMVQPRTARRGVLKLLLGEEKEMSQGWREWARRDELIRHSCFLFLKDA